METFVTIDFETANEKRDSPCEIGLVRFVDGEPVESFQTFLFQERFSPFNIMLHGITPEAVSASPTLDECVPQILDFIGQSPLVAHNAAFDIRILQAALNRTGASFVGEFYCTLILARHTLGYPENGLAYVAEQLDIEHEGAHRAVGDAISCGLVAVKMLQNSNFEKLEQLSAAANIKLGTFSAFEVNGGVKKYVPSGKKNTSLDFVEILKQIPESEMYSDPDFEGKNIVFTGALQSMTQTEAQISVLKAGGMPQNDVTKATNLLVYGYQDPRVLRGKPLSGKRLKAAKYLEAGHEIEIIDEILFLEMLSDRDGLNG